MAINSCHSGIGLDLGFADIEEERTNSSSSMSPSSWDREKRERWKIFFIIISKLNKKPPKKNSWSQTVQTTRLGWQASKKFTHHKQQELMIWTVRLNVNKYFSIICKLTQQVAGPIPLPSGLKPSFTHLEYDFRLAKPPWRLLSACVPIRFCVVAPAASMVDVSSWFSHFQFPNGLASNVFVFAPSLWLFSLLQSKCWKTL